MNLAGPVKRSPLSDFAFLAGERMIQAWKFPVRQYIRLRQPTGMESIYALEADPQALKAAAMAMEESLPVGRLFDMDVIGPDGMKLPRLQPRPCLVCGGAAAPCARSRAHGLGAVQAATASLLEAFAADALGGAARDALLEEARLTPKPGLIDLANNGAHKDMDLESFCRSAQALAPYFRQAVRIGLSHSASGPAMEALRPAGIAAEAAMLAATLREFDAQYGAHMFDKTAPYPGMPQLLARLHARGVRMAVYSNKADEFAGEVVARYFDPALFALVRGARPGVPTKPAPEGTRALLAALGADPAAGNVLYVGDSNVDVATAHNAGLPCCGVLWGFRTKQELQDAGAEYLAADAAALERVILGKN